MLLGNSVSRVSAETVDPWLPVRVSRISKVFLLVETPAAFARPEFVVMGESWQRITKSAPDSRTASPLRETGDRSGGTTLEAGPTAGGAGAGSWERQWRERVVGV